MKNYLVLPINDDAANRDICITPEQGSDYGLSVRIDSKNPKFYIYIDVTHLGKIKSISLNEDEYSFSSFRPSKKETLRPKIHYTVQNGWNNDPNGMLYYDGTYHMFYQFNPAGNTWGNMHWGHATSKDMIHFKEEDVSLFPDYLGAVYSGSAIVDFDNVTGLKENGNDPIILFYTAAAYRFNQCIAYSTDKGKTFKRYKHNPILPYTTFWNRDPKVIKCDELGCYIMALYLDKSTFALYKSQNLLDWDELQRIEIPGDYECPDIYKLKIEDTDEYAYVLQGACGSYLIGKIANGKFEFDSNPKKCLYGDYINYCGQSYSNLGDRVVQVYWQKSIVYPDMPWGSNLSLPQEVTLVKDGSDLRLHVYMAKEFDAIDKEPFVGGEASPDYGYDIHCDVLLSSDPLLRCFGVEVPIPDEYRNEHINLRIIVDTIGITVYINKGERFTTIAALPDYSQPIFEAINCKKISRKAFKIKPFIN